MFLQFSSLILSKLNSRSDFLSDSSLSKNDLRKELSDGSL